MPGLPTGTVTFLYTDIEGSTKRWEANPRSMKAAVERHDAILRKTIKAHGGVVFRTEGDAYRAAFSTASQALEAALDAQVALAAEPWPEQIAPIRVRMALHSGEGEVRDNDYVGAHLNRVARLLATGHGGQILLTRAAFDLVRDALPAGADVRSLGDHRLKDLQRPEEVYQATAEGQPTDFPPLSTLDSHPNNLPVQRSPLVGREKELAAVEQLLLRPDVGLLSLVGPGGIGKTRLALQVAADMVDHFADGVFFVPLAPVATSDLVVAAVAQALHVEDASNAPLEGRLANFLAQKRLLLVLDNFEQVVEAGPAVAGLLAGAPGLKALVTSREVLHLRGEQEFEVPPLALPSLRHLPSPEALSEYDAVALFIQRARLVQRDFEINNDNAPAVAEICFRLDGLPLAIELAAARVRLLPPQALLERLSSRLRLLTGGARDQPERQQTLRDAIRWSFDLLHPGEQALFKRLSVFRGGCSLEAAEAICASGAPEGIDTFDGVASLVDKSLLRQGASLDGEPRFIMLETIGEYAEELLESEPAEADEVRRRHAEFFTELAETAAPQLNGREQAAWLNRLETEHDNIRAVFAWAVDRKETAVALRLVAAIWRFWHFRGFELEGRTWLERVLALPGAEERTALRARALVGLGRLTMRQGDYELARAFSTESAAISKELGPGGELDLAEALGLQAALGFFLGDTEQEVRSASEESLAIARKAGIKVELARGLMRVGITSTARGLFADAQKAFEEALALFRETGDDWGAAQVLNGAGDMMRIQGDYAGARLPYEEGLELCRKLGLRADIPAALHNLGYVALAEGDLARAESLFNDALDQQADLKNNAGIAECLAGLSALAAARGEGERAARLLGAATAMWDATGGIHWATERVEYDRTLARARALLSADDWERTWSAGKALSPAQAIALARSSHD